MKFIRRTVDQGALLLDIHAADVEAVITAALDRAHDLGLMDRATCHEAHRELMRHEAVNSSIVGHATAIPHAYLEGLSEDFLIMVRLAKGLNLGAPDHIPTRFFFVIVGSRESSIDHVDTLTSLLRLMTDDEFHFLAGEIDTAAELTRAIDEYEQRQMVSEPTPTSSGEGLSFTGRFAGGLLEDIKRRLPVYGSDIKDGLHPKTISSVLFLFFAALAPAITFGGFMEISTGGAIGAVEMIVATAFCGVVYALFAGQPLIILGGTGPLLILTVLIYQLCGDLRLPFLPVYAWIGLWSAAFTVLLAVTDASFLMRYFTRFTDEIFSALISIIFIFEAISALTKVFADPALSKDTALLSLLLAIGTYYIATRLSTFRRSKYLIPAVREFFADFGPAIAILLMTVLSLLVRDVDVQVLKAPAELGTSSGRPWLVPLFAIPSWAMWAAAVPALLVTVLVFLDQNITARIVNAPDHKLQRGVAYHLDLLVVGGLLALCSLFGLPWLVAATVRSLNHLRSLATTEEIVSSGGETQERIIYVRENRISGFMIHALVGLALLALPLLRSIPMAVLYGLFLFMGVASIRGNQFFDRMSLWLTDPNLYPSTHYMRRVPKPVIHTFTAVQFVCLALLWVVKTSALGIFFPVFIALLVPVRLVLDRFMDASHLLALDAEESPEDEEDRRID